LRVSLVDPVLSIRPLRALPRLLLAALTLWPLWLAAQPATTFTEGDFTVSDIRVEGLQRISEGTVFNYLPVNIGDHLNAQRLREAVRALYATGFFRDVELHRDGTTLVVAVLERPSLESVDIKGNKDIKTEDLQKSLRNVGLSAGKTFDRSTLDDVTQYLTDQYYSRGKYAVKIDTKVEELPDNRVRVNINITEGSRAKIRQINIVGNSKFRDKDILSTLSLQTPNLTSWYKQDDRYSRESLQGDIDKIQSYYQDRGYANFRTDSVQVTIAPDKADMFITVNVTPGEIYELGDIKLGGTLVVPEAELRRLLLVAPGQVYSQRTISATQQAIVNRLGADGFYFAKVSPVPEIDEAKRTVNLTLFVDPGSRVYVRRISFAGTTRANDETMRREMRQLEGAWLSNSALERSKQRLQRLPYVESVDVATDPVAGSADLVDVTFNVKERSSATVGGGIGYSASQKFVLNGNFSDSDFFGSGNYVALTADSGIYNKVYQLSQTNPYQTIDGLSRTVSLTYRDSTQYVAESSNFSARNFAFGVNYGYPISEFQFVNAGFSLQRVNLLTYASSSALEAIQWVQGNGHPFTGEAVDTIREPDGSATTESTAVYGTDFDLLELSVGWLYDSRNRTLFATNGTRIALSTTYVPPGSDVRYWVSNFAFSTYVPLIRRFLMELDAQVDYGVGIGGTSTLPPYKRFYAGGPDDVRGYYEDTLGPVDSNGNPYGGNLKTVARAELIFPMPEKWETSAQVGWFFDFGNTFSQDSTAYVGKDLETPVDYKFSYHELKRSTGIAMQWLAPSLGVFRFSLGIPLNASPGNDIDYGDRREVFQFTVGQSF
jgi:outer membrane protein insertion porin family